MKSANTKSGKSVSKKPSHSGGGSVVKKPANPGKPVNPGKSGPTVIKKLVSKTEPVWDLTEFQGSAAAHEAWDPSRAHSESEQILQGLGRIHLEVLQTAWHQRVSAEAISKSEPQPWHFEIAQTFKAPDRFVVWLSCATSEQIPDGLMVMKKEGGAYGKLTFVSPVTEHPLAECPIISERSE